MVSMRLFSPRFRRTEGRFFGSRPARRSRRARGRRVGTGPRHVGGERLGVVAGAFALVPFCFFGAGGRKSRPRQRRARRGRRRRGRAVEPVRTGSVLRRGSLRSRGRGWGREWGGRKRCGRRGGLRRPRARPSMRVDRPPRQGQRGGHPYDDPDGERPAPRSAPRVARSRRPLERLQIVDRGLGRGKSVRSQRPIVVAGVRRRAESTLNSHRNFNAIATMHRATE